MKNIGVILLTMVLIFTVGLFLNNMLAGEAGVGMAMALAGYTKVCGLQSGGMKTLYLVEVGDLTSFTLLAGEYTTATMTAAKVFKQYQFDQDSFDLKEDVSIENNSMKVAHSIEFYLAKMGTVGRNAVEEIALATACGMIAIAEDNNGTKWVLGYSENMKKTRPLELKTSAGTSGKKLTDANGYTIKLESEDNESMHVYTGVIPV